MNCKNCGTELASSTKFCHNCGARVVRNKLTFKNLAMSFSAQFLNVDNKFLKTFIALFIKPEDVIDGYVNGLRKRYVSPGNYFAIALTLSGLYLIVMQKYFPEALDISNLAAEGQEQFSKDYFDFFMKNQGLVFFANIPIYTFIAWLTFKTLKRYNLVSHSVLFFYTIPQMSFAFFIPQLILMFLGLTIGEFSFVILFLQMIYTGYVYQRIFRLTPQGFTLRCMLFLVVLFILFVLTSVILFVYMLKTGGFDELIEAQKKAQESALLLGDFFLNKLYFV